jgi:type I restriction enzyme R subunit
MPCFLVVPVRLCGAGHLPHSEAQQFTINFTNNNLLGSANFMAAYKTSKARVCVTVGMMTTGYDCPDLLNLA